MQNGSNWKQDAEYIALIQDLIEHEEVLQMEKIKQHHFTNRLEHSLRVSYVSYQISKKYNLDARASARAGLLHDFFLLGREDVALLHMGSHANAHPKLACQNAERITVLDDKERDIILKHMFLVSTSGIPRYKESFVVTYVDKYVSCKEVFTPIKSKITYRIENFLAKHLPVRFNS